MKISIRLLMGLLVPAFILAGAVVSPAMAADAPPSFKGDPDVYKVIFEDQNFRVIDLMRKKGVHDKAHGHPLPFVSYTLTDCTTRNYAADGKTTDSTSKAGTVRAGNVVGSHSQENTGTADCHVILVERK